ncbi:MAG: Nif3-like dinuclear metal center hexameric protein [Bacillota bacterium]
MKLADFISMMERIAPPELALSYDNVGLLIGTEKTTVERVLVALDCTSAVAEEAARLNCDLVLAHHPVFFEPVRRILPGDPKTVAAYRLIQNGIGLYAAHTNLDAADGGVNDALSELLALGCVEKLPPDGLGRIGMRDEILLGSLAREIEIALDASVRVVGDPNRPIHRVAVVGGAGGDAIAARNAGADVLVTGEVKHHEALAAQEMGIALIQAGHYETERVVLERLISRLQREDSRIKYMLTLAEKALFRSLE